MLNAIPKYYVFMPRIPYFYPLSVGLLMAKRHTLMVITPGFHRVDDRVSSGEWYIAIGIAVYFHRLIIF